MSSIRTPLISGVTDQAQVRSKNYLPTAYAVGKIFTGVTLPDNIDLNTYVVPGVSRVKSYKNGPPITSSGYLVIHSVNPDEDKSDVKYRYRQIYYPDSATETTPYTRVGVGTSSNSITWSTWSTMGGNWVCEILNGNKTGIVNYMYHSFGDWTLTLPDPTAYVSGTKIGLTQWQGTGKVVYASQEEITTPDVTDDGTTVGALQYIFQIVPNASGVNVWSLEVDDNLNGVLDDLSERFQNNIDELNTTVVNLGNKIDQEIRDRTNADTSIRNDFASADTAIRNDFTAADASLREDFTAADATIRNEFRSADSAIREDFTAADAAMKTEYTTLINRKQKLMKYLERQSTITFINNTNNPDLGNNLAFFDYTATMTKSGTVTLPTTYAIGSRVVLLICPGVSTTVKFNNVTEIFTNNYPSPTMLVVDLQATWTDTSSTWTVLEISN